MRDQIGRWSMWGLARLMCLPLTARNAGTVQTLTAKPDGRKFWTERIARFWIVVGR